MKNKKQAIQLNTQLFEVDSNNKITKIIQIKKETKNNEKTNNII